MSLEIVPFLASLEKNAEANQQTDMVFSLNENSEIIAKCNYTALLNEAKTIAKTLRDNHLQGQRVLLLFPAGIEFITAILGCFYAKAIAVPINIPHGRQIERVKHVIMDCLPKAALSTNEVIAHLKSTIDNTVIDFNSQQQLESVTYVPIKTVCQTTSALPIAAEKIALIQYTSGSTFYPKGVIVSYDNLAYMCNYIQSIVGLTTKDKSLTWLPNYHDMGLVDGLLTPLYTGYPVYIMSPSTFIKKPSSWLNAISRYRISHSGGPNFSYDLCAQHLKENNLKLEQLDLSCWTSAYNAAEPIRKETLDKFLAAAKRYDFDEASLYCCYGLAEAVLMVTCGAKRPLSTASVSAESLRAGKIKLASEKNYFLVSSGTTKFSTHIAIVHPDTLCELPYNEVGEIWVSGASVTAGYWNNNEATSHTFNAYTINSGKGPFLRTGDLGYISELGELFVTGRLKDVIIINGENYYPTDIEKIAESASPYSKIHDSVAFCIDDNDTQLIKVVLVLRIKNFPTSLNFAVLAEQIAQKVYEINNINLASIVLTDEAIPKTSSGKVQRQQTKKLFLTNRLKILYQWDNKQMETTNRTEQESLRILLENHIVFWLANNLKVSVQEIDKEASFSTFALDSIKILDMLDSIENIVQFSIPQSVVQEHASISKLAYYLANEKFATEEI